MGGDNCQNFLREVKSHMLCFWQMNDENNTLSHSLEKLSDNVRVDSENIPNAMDTARTNKKRIVAT